MRPILAIIPALPQRFLIPAFVLAFLVGALAAFKIKSATPLVFSLGVAFLAYLWSRQSITLHSYGLFLVLGFFLSTYLACLEAKRRGFDPNIILDAAMPLLLVSILLCRVLYFLIYPSQWAGFGQFLQIWNGGLSFHGAIIGALGTLAYFSYARKIPFGTLCDSISPGMFLGYGVGRIGCFMNGCCYGHETHLPWGVVFPDETNRLISTPPSHPAQLYSTFLSLIIFAVMWRARTKPAFNRFPGQMAMLLLAFIAVERFIIEFFRKGATAPLAFGLDWLTKAQLASVLGIIVLAALYAVLSRRPHTQSALQTAPSNHVSAR
ncbi:Prolipoprotein diacylglyceryl transferase [Abditibacterium utsteinense]|uniref:Phosphatidylglycerol--prolipoprotein diacylglyceryl transferase n=1 Tax=Abditibacterium utsteinense TaxID=1960156 RepID=A0A2S8SSZ3_9BACT|nr:prolipoprotein diacylglyceryl transferase [Abditibacterium utsteinense]PQV63932.1 Prolipoprotein diacylglyceryl transferase [Abditibacterium utsteinense]